MPEHRVPRASAQEEIRRIERSGETVRYTIDDGDCVIVVTEDRGETRVEL